MTTLAGQCHCGNIQYRIETPLPAEQITARACDCSFCRLHGAKNWSDPDGRAVITISDEALLTRYLFALKTSEFLICRQCGAYAAAVLNGEDGLRATLNLRLTGMRDIAEQSISFGGETTADRVARRQRVWMPVEVVTAGNAC